MCLEKFMFGYRLLKSIQYRKTSSSKVTAHNGACNLIERFSLSITWKSNCDAPIIFLFIISANIHGASYCRTVRLYVFHSAYTSKPFRLFELLKLHFQLKSLSPHFKMSRSNHSDTFCTSALENKSICERSLFYS